ncbi:hypothetical protein FVB32_05510 [Flagellimonas hymeniacidonis]|uniref:Initiator Rep protein domain-containing protein n=1 Tax=Flagellimonas hymeniacidonis TaxID=2603628 RepID=A0A5C8V7T9_9FLAO|nr:hypothetical protein [Flagellimonas hymeniacidonis]TXN37747.1 hypothetical protein FVB32_05510 [Flagellimonas hymeniacidonis]
MKTTAKVLQPLRFVNAYYDFTATQKDFIMLVQHMTSKQKEIVSNFKIDLKPYFLAKGLTLEDIRQNHYKELTEDLLESKVTFKYLKGDTLYSIYNLFSRCIVNQNFILEVSILDDVLPLFYINKLDEGHFQENRLVRELFEQSFPKYDQYISYYPQTFIEFKESQTKKLFEKLLAFSKLQKYTFEFSKDELYLILGYGHLRDKSQEKLQQNIFKISDQEFVQTSYKGVDGWKSLRRQLNKWLKEISDKKDTGIIVVPNGNNYFSTRGKPIRSIMVQVEYDNLSTLNNDQRIAYEFLTKYELSHKQILKIIDRFAFKDIKARIHNRLVAKTGFDGKRYYGEYQRADHRKIENVPGYIYGVVFSNDKL